MVAIFAAFIITSIVNNRAAFLRKSSRMRELLAESERLVAPLKARRFDWYNEQVTVRNLHAFFLFANIDGKTTGESIATHYPGPRYMSHEDYVATLDEWIRIERKEGGGKAAAIRALFVDRGEIIERSQEADAEGERIGELVVQAQHQIRINKLHIDETAGNPERSPLVAVMSIQMGLLFLVGVIAPLSFLPFPNGMNLSDYPYFTSATFSIKGFLLFAVVGFFGWTVVKLLQENAANVYSTTDRERLSSFCDIGTYSPYLKIMEENLSRKYVSVPSDGGDGKM